MQPARFMMNPWVCSMGIRLLASTTCGSPLLVASITAAGLESSHISSCSTSLCLQLPTQDSTSSDKKAIPSQSLTQSPPHHKPLHHVFISASRPHWHHSQHMYDRHHFALHWLHTQHKPDTQGSQQASPATTPTTNTSSVIQDSLWTPPNMLSIARAISGPFIAYFIMEGNWSWALAATAISGASDWADGALARRLGQSSVLGSYLDPLADKVLVASVVLALVARGNAPTWLAVLVVGRDVGLVTGMMLHRWRSLGWRTTGLTMSQFFNTDSGSGVPLMQPLMISKVNTVFQLTLVCSCMTNAWVNVPDASLLHQLEMLTAATTAASLGAYVWAYATGRLLPLPVNGK